MGDNRLYFFGRGLDSDRNLCNSSVRDYIERVDEEIKAKVGFLTDESTSLRQECADLQRAFANVKEKNAALSEEKNRLDTEKEELEQRCKVLSVRLDTQERLASEMRSAKKDQEKEQGELADIPIEAEKFADELKHRHRTTITKRSPRTMKELTVSFCVSMRISTISMLCAKVFKSLTVASNRISVRKVRAYIFYGISFPICLRKMRNQHPTPTTRKTRQSSRESIKKQRQSLCFFISVRSFGICCNGC